jgi:hypothetical protein
MKISVNNGVPTPQAHVAINKSRLKIYNKDSNTPTYYLQKGQEFQLELFNPTNNTILAKIFLNGNAISQGGLVLRPGERVFLDRYIDVAKKFLFDTYEVENTSEVKKAIEDNGDFKVEFYNEYKPSYFGGYNTFKTNLGGYYNQHITYTNNVDTFLSLDNSIGASSYNTTSINALYNTSSLNKPTTPQGPNVRSKKSIETGRVEKGSTSNQKLETVSMSWDYSPFHTVEYKMLPISQKINTTEDINVKRYCTNCGSKLGKGHKFCANCGTKA